MSSIIVAVAMLVPMFGVQPAAAMPPGIDAVMTINGDQGEYDGQTVLEPGDTLTLAVQYSQDVGAGTSVEFEVSEHLKVDGVPEGNEAIDSIAQEGGKVTITFKNPWPTGVNQGVFELDFSVDTVEHSSEKTITWRVGDETQSIDVIIRKPGDEFAQVTNQTAKDISAGNLSQHVSVQNSKVVLADGIKDETIEYTLTVHSDAPVTDFNISDALPEGLSYVADSFEGQITRWDENGLNQSSGPYDFTPTIDGGEFSGAITVGGPFELQLTYEVQVTDKAALEAALQRSYDDLGDDGGTFTADFTNTATFEEEQDRATFTLSGTVEGLDEGAAFNKSAVELRPTAKDAEGNVISPINPDGEFQGPIDVVYTFDVDLSQFDGTTESRTLDGNVVIEDMLIPQMSWQVGDDFITAEGVVFTPASPAPASADAFAGDDYVNRYWVDGQTLRINVGQDPETDVTIRVKAQIDTLTGGDGIEALPTANEDGSTVYIANNKADFHFGPGSTHTSGVDVGVLVPGVGVGNAFSKNADWATSEVLPDTEGNLNPAKDITYTFQANLSHWTGVSPGTTLRRNVVIEDTLIPQMSWQVGDDFITATGIELAPASPAPATADDFEGNHYVGTYWVDGQTLRINVGQRNVNVTVEAKAQIDTVAGIVAGSEGWNTTYPVPNTASFDYRNDVDPYTDDANVTVWAPGANPGQAFSKSASNVEGYFTSEDGTTLDSAADVLYTIEADLSQWVGDTPTRTLTQNVIIEDTLGSQARWNSEADDFITADGIELTPVAEAPASAEAFLEDAYVGTYWVDGQTLRINIGDEPETVVSFQIRAEITSTDGLGEIPTNIVGGDARVFPNTASFDYGAENRFTSDAEVDIVVVPNTDQGVNNPDAFSKTGEAASSVGRGETLEVDYTFTVGADLGIDMRNSTIIDYIDHEVFDLSDLSAVGIVGDYAGEALDASHFDLSLDANDDLVIELSAAGDAVVEEHGPDQAFWVTISLESFPFAEDSGETKRITNRVVLFGEDDVPFFWSEDYTESTSFGDELEVRKTVFSKSDDRWVETLQAETDGRGNLLESRFVYAVELIPHGRFNNVVISDIIDPIPGAVEFLGFVDESEVANIDEQTEFSQDPVDLGVGSNVEAAFDNENNQVIFRQKDGTRLQAGEPILAYFAVEIIDDSAPIINVIDNVPPVIIQPLHKVGVGDYVWLDSDRDGIQNDGPDAGIAGVVLNIVGPDNQPVRDVYGNIVLPQTTDENGYYWFGNLPLLSGEDQYTVVIDQAASAEALAGLVPTTADAGDDRAADSSTWQASSLAGGLAEDGAEDPTLDFGFYQPAVSVGDYVWLDTNRDGIQNDGEDAGIAGVVLTITGPDGDSVVDVDGNPVGPQTTDENGFYSFDLLPTLEEGQSYTVTIDQAASAEALAGLIPTLEGEGEDGAVDSSTWTASSGDLTENGDRDPTLDFGFVYPRVSVGDYVWWDNNRDGLQDEGEPGIPGVTLTLTGPDGEPVTDIHGNEVEPTITDDEGYYSFVDLPVLPEGESYRVTITAPEGAVPTTPNAGDDRGQDSSTEYAESGDLTTDGAHDPTLDFGFIPKVSVGDFVWWDTNRDGIQDEGEAGIPGVELTLTGPDGESVTNVHGELVEPTTTDEGGYYVFEDLPVLPEGESYRVTITPPEGAVPTTPNAGDDRAVDSSTGYADSGDLTVDGAEDMTLDFGFVPEVSVGDYVWWDTNRDGIQNDGDDAGIPDVTLTISRTDGEDVFNVLGEEVTTTTTDEDGFYLFDRLPVLPEDVQYVVTITPPEGAEPTIEEGTPNTGLDSSTGSATATDNLRTDGAKDLSLDFGFVPEVSVGDFVWWDTDRDGIQDEGEPGIPGVTLEISRTDGERVENVLGEVVTTTTTDEDGFYSFDRLPVLPEGEFYVVTVTPPEGVEPTVPGAGDDREVDSSTGSATARDLRTNGDRDPSLDFGFVPEVSVGDYVWWDTNRDGLQDEGEPGIPGVTLTISRTDGEPVFNVLDEPVTTTETDDEGKYLFDRLPVLPEDVQYVVTVTPPNGAEPTLEGEGDDRGLDSSTGSATARDDLRTNGAQDLTLDFGFYPEVSVGDFVWWDTNRDGLQDEGEPGIPGVTLTITRTDDQPVVNVVGETVTETTTNSEGHYSFDRLPVLPEGEFYVVTVTPPAGVLPTLAGVGDDRALDSSTDWAQAEALPGDGDRDPTLDFGFVPEVSVGDFVWWDNDGDGIQDEGEPGIPGVTLEISRTDGEPVENVEGEELTTTTTDEDGFYSFDRLPVLPEDVQYVVTITPPEGAQPTVPGVGDDREVDSSTDTATARDDLRRHGDRDPSLDFGFIPKVSVGDFVWWDNDGDGIQDEGEPGIPGVELTITDPEGNPVTDIYGDPVGPTTTDEDGRYVFEDLPVLPEGESYRVTITPPEGAVPTTPNAGDDRGRDSSTGYADSGDLTEDGQHDPTLDFGFIPKVSVGDFVWWDDNGDGIQGEGEPGIPGVTLTLTGPDGEPVTDVFGDVVEPTTTDEDGYYVFENLPVLPEGESYRVTVTPPEGAVASPAEQGEDRGVDSSTGYADSGDLTVDGAHDPTLDFGFIPKVSVGDFVWFDTNSDGRQDDGEPGIPGVVLVLTGPDGQPVVDVHGNVVEPTVTDEDGYYSFDDLPVLAHGESYRVSIDVEASAEALEGLVPTLANVGDRAGDSDLWFALSIGLTTNGERDATLDFGFTTEPVVQPDPPTPTEPPVRPGLPPTGVDGEGAAPLALLALIGVAAAAFMARARA